MVALVEGSTDEDFFPAVLERSLNEILTREVEPMVSVDVVVEVVRNGGVDRPQWVVEHVRERYPNATILALHFDGSAKPSREKRKYYEPLQRCWEEADLAAEMPLVALTPIKEMEAWALADLSVVADTAGVDVVLTEVFEGDMLSSPERLSDPKRSLADIIGQGKRPRGRTAKPEDHLPLIAERLPLTALRRLRSFCAFERDVEQALAALGWK